MEDDAELLRHYAEDGSQEAFTELVRRNVNLVYCAALRRVGGDGHLAQDVTQQVFVALARKAPGLVDRPVLAGWLHTASRFASLRAVRAERRRQAREHEAHLMGADPQSDPDWDRLRPVLDEAMDELSLADREALLLRFFEGRSYGEAGARLRLTEDAARKRVDRAVGRLRVLLARRGIASTAAAVASLIEANAVTAAPAALAASVAGVALSSPAASALDLLNLMSHSKLAAGAAAVVAALAVATAVYEVRADLLSRRALEAVLHGNRALDAELAAAEREARSAEGDRAAAEKALGAAKAAVGAADARAASEAAAAGVVLRDPRAAGRDLLAARPQAARHLTAYFRQRTADVYGGLFKALGLTDGQIQAFEDLRVRGTAGVNWASATQAPAGGFSAGDLSAAQMETQLRILLGDAGYRQYQDYNASAAPRMLSMQLGSALYLTPTPLTSEQAAQLTVILGSSGPSAGNPDWDAAISRARGVLSDAQLAALSGLRRQVQYQLALSQAVDQAMQQAANEARIAAGIVAQGDR